MLRADLSNKQVGYSDIEKTTNELLVKIDSLIDEIGEKLA
jgi:hypothetical protein